MRRKLDPGEANLGNLYAMGPEEAQRRGIRMLPESLAEALSELERDDVVKNSLGPIAPEFISLKWDEWKQYHRQVGSWRGR